MVIDGKAVYRDAYYEEYRLAVELDGRLAHPEEERWRDRRRDNQAGMEDILTTRYDWQGRPRPPVRDRPAPGPDPAAARLAGQAPALLGRLPGRGFPR